MSEFGIKSREIRDELHHIWQEILDEAIKSDYFDFSLVDGYRSNEQQEKEFAAGNSKAHAGESAHNYLPSFGVDLIPYPSEYKDPQAMLLLAGHIIGTAERLGYKVTCGCDWDRDGMVIDTTFRDFWHFELTDWRQMI
jgi:peptidoglycan L-alanyl-D-glutamate endopeptidase CwlK